MAIESTRKYSAEYLRQINTVLTSRMDGNNGKKDGRVTVSEAYKDLNPASLLSGLKAGTVEYNKLKLYTGFLPQILKQYAGKDGVFQAKEWADFLNGKEWNNILDTYHSSSNSEKIEMGWIDSARGMKPDGMITKGEVKAGLIQNMLKINPNYNMTIIENMIDRYAGKDGIFTLKEYTDMKNNLAYSAFLKEYKAVPFYDRNIMG